MFGPSGDVVFSPDETGLVCVGLVVARLNVLGLLGAGREGGALVPVMAFPPTPSTGQTRVPRDDTTVKVPS